MILNLAPDKTIPGCVEFASREVRIELFENLYLQAEVNLLWWTLPIWLGGSKRQSRGIIQHLTFLRREVTFISVGLYRPLPRVWRHRSQGLHGIANRLAAVRRELLHLLV